MHRCSSDGADSDSGAHNRRHVLGCSVGPYDGTVETVVTVTATLADGFEWQEATVESTGFAGPRRAGLGIEGSPPPPIDLPEGWTYVSPTEATFGATLAPVSDCPAPTTTTSTTTTATGGSTTTPSGGSTTTAPGTTAPGGATTVADGVTTVPGAPTTAASAQGQTTAVETTTAGIQPASPVGAVLSGNAVCGLDTGQTTVTWTVRNTGRIAGDDHRRRPRMSFAPRHSSRRLRPRLRSRSKAPPLMRHSVRPSAWT